MKKLLSDDRFSVFAVIASIQGMVIVSQFLAAFVMTTNEVGVMRSIESILSLLILAAGIGAQTLIVRDIAAVNCSATRRRILITSLLGIMLGFAVCLIVLLVAGIFARSAILSLLITSGGIILLNNAVRSLIAYAHGAKCTSKIHKPLIITSVCAVMIILLSCNAWGLNGWILGRYIAEVTVFAAVLITLHKAGAIDLTLPCFRQPTFVKSLAASGMYISHHLPSFVRRGIQCNVSLLLRVAADAAPVLAVTAMKVPTDQIAQIGMAILATQIVMLPLAVSAQHALPRIVGVVRREAEARTAVFQRHILTLAITGAVLFAFLSLGAYYVIGGAYGTALVCASILSISFPFKAVSLFYGTLLIANDSYLNAAVVNAFELVAIGILVITLYNALGISGTAIAVVLTSIFTSVGMAVAYESKKQT